MIRIVLPFHLKRLAQVDGEVQLEVEGPVTQRSVLDALEARYPMLIRTFTDLSFRSLAISGSSDSAGGPICPSAHTALDRTSSSGSFSMETIPGT